MPRSPLAVADSPSDVIYAVEDLLGCFLAAEIDAFEGIDPELGVFARSARDCVLAGGKRIRPTFGYWGWRGAAGEHWSVGTVLPALAALELLHAFALVHDDVMDRSATRRGRPTAHRIHAAAHRDARRRGDADRFGESAAVLVGDLCLVWADRLLATADVSSATLLAARRVYDQMRVEAVAGQYLDVLGEAEPHRWTPERAMAVARLKTAGYTVLRPLHLGAALSGRTVAGGLSRAYERYGRAVGEAFQLRDDLLGVYGDPAVTGKPAGDDLRTGRPTTLLTLARERATPAQRAELDRVWAGGFATADGEVSRLAGVVADTGAPIQVEHMIGVRVATALEALADAPVDAETRGALTDLAIAATRRRA